MASTDLVIYEGVIPFAAELKMCQDAIANLEILLYETWETDSTLTKDAARRFLRVAAVFDWDMPWLDEMRRWAS